MPVSLDQILSSTRDQLLSLQDRRAVLERQAPETPQPPALIPVLRRPTIAVIAEVKRRSPSAGVIRELLNPADRAELYAAHGAAAISVLTDGPYFGGSIADLRAAAQRVSLPVLRKDFILDELQIVEARAAGAAAVLLIVRALLPARLTQLLRCARDWGLEALVEVHTGDELEMALEAGAYVIGINSRDLDTFQIDTASAWELLGRIPADRIAVAESGMAGAADVVRAAAAGADAVLIGTALSAAPEPGPLVAELAGVRRYGR